MNDPRKLNDAEIDAVTGGLNELGDAAQTFGGRALGSAIHDLVQTVGGQQASQVIVQAAQTPAP